MVAVGGASVLARYRARAVRVAMLMMATIGVACGLGGCGDAGSGAPPQAEGRVEGPAAPAGDGASGAVTEPSAPGSSDTVPGGQVLAVEGEGLRVIDAATGAARPIPFGAPMAEVVAVLSALAGGPPREAGENPDCGVAYATWATGLSVTFTNSRLAGWSIRAGDDPPTTASGIGIGSTRREIESVYDARFFDSSLGNEFSAGALAGVLDSAGADGRVMVMWAGHVCLAR